MHIDNYETCAQGENRTLTMLPSMDFESIASTNSATWAKQTALHLTQILFYFILC
jgi:hypothetical protein